MTGYASGQRRVQTALSIVLESAFIYTVALVFLIATSCAGLAIVFFFLNSMPPIIGSVFTFVILRSSSGGRGFTGENSSTVLRNDMQLSAITDTGVGMKSMNSCSDGVRVHLERTVHHDTSSERKPEGDRLVFV